MPSRLVRSATAIALASSASFVAYAGSAAPARAAGYNGYCKTSSGVTVVVDFRNLGGGIAIRCAQVGGGATGLDALQAAGIPVVQPVKWPGVACRLYGKPSASATLPGGYHEQCVNMPPNNAHWWYSQAPNGGSWSSSSEGMSSSHVIPGGFEGWAFSEGSSNHPPRLTPTRPSAPRPSPTHTTTRPPAPPRHTTTTAPKHHPAPSTHDGGTSTGSRPTSTTSTAPPKSTKSAKGGAKSTNSSKAKSAKSSRSASHSSTSSTSSTSHGTHSSSSAAGVTGRSSGGSTNAAGAPIANSDNLIHNSKKSSGVNATTVVGGIVLAAIVIGGGVVAAIRRRNLG